GLLIEHGINITTGPGLPFTLDELDIFGPCAATMWVLVRNASGDPATNKIHKLDLDLCDEIGNVRVRMRGFTSRMLEGQASSVGSAATGTLLLQPCWREQDAAGDGSYGDGPGGKEPASQHQRAHVQDAPRQLAVFCELDQCSPEVIEPYLPGATCLYWHVEDE